MVIRRNCGFFLGKKAYKLYGIAIFDHFSTKIIGVNMTKALKKRRDVSKSAFW
jgi:hypothetical protein